jgi:hypothetical protein
MPNRRVIPPLLLVTRFPAPLSLAQVSTAELSGTAADPTGAVISPAKVWS